jgi:hypothetical protein
VAAVGQGGMVHNHGGQKGDLEEGQGHAACAQRAQRARHPVHTGAHSPLGPCLVFQGASACCKQAARPSSHSSKACLPLSLPDCVLVLRMAPKLIDKSSIPFVTIHGEGSDTVSSVTWKQYGSSTKGQQLLFPICCSLVAACSGVMPMDMLHFRHVYGAMSCRSKLTFSLSYPKGDASKLLSLLASTVEAHGGVVKQQLQTFSLRAQFELQQTATIGCSNPVEAQAERQWAIAPASNGSGESGIVNGPKSPSAGMAEQLEPDVKQRSAKRQRTWEKAEKEGVIQRQVEFEMTMTLRQESVGSFAVLASLQQDRLLGADAALGFTQKCFAVQQDIKQLLMGM